MSNTESSELTHNYTTTLIVDCGKHNQELTLPNYQFEHDKDVTLHIGKDLKHPTPIAIEFDNKNSHSRIGLYSDKEVLIILEELQKAMGTVLQAGVVNEKQRRALNDIVHKEFVRVKSTIYSR